MQNVSVRSVSVPALGLGTWPMTGEACRTAVETALDLGYRHIDTAQMYDNEAPVGAAIAEATVDRGDVFLVTKVLRENLAEDRLLESVDVSLDRLGTSIDLLLIHAPSRSVTIEESIGAMNRLQDRGDVAHIGVSNFGIDGLETAIRASSTPILTNQVEYHPFEQRDELLSFCLDNDVMLTAYSPLAQGNVIGNDTLREIGDRHDKTAAQVALRWLIQQPNVSAIPKASGRVHQRENLEIFDFSLSADEMAAIFELGGGIVDRLRRRLGF